MALAPGVIIDRPPATTVKDDAVTATTSRVQSTAVSVVDADASQVRLSVDLAGHTENTKEFVVDLQMSRDGGGVWGLLCGLRARGGTETADAPNPATEAYVHCFLPAQVGGIQRQLRYRYSASESLGTTIKVRVE
jgi:hypothetical protein